MNGSPPDVGGTNVVRINLTAPTFDMEETSPPNSIHQSSNKSPKNRHISRRSSTDDDDVGIGVEEEASSNSPDSGVGNVRTASAVTVASPPPLTASPMGKSESPMQQSQRNLEENFESYGENNDVEYEK